MKRWTWGSALTAGLAATAVALALLLGAVLRMTAPSATASASMGDGARHPEPQPRRDRGPHPDKSTTPDEKRPPVRHWRGLTPELQPPKPRRAAA